MLCQSILTLCVRPLELRFGTIRCLASDTRNIDKTFSRAADSTLTAMGSSFDHSFPAPATQVISFG